MFIAQMQMNMEIMIRFLKLLKFKLICLGQIDALRDMHNQEPADVLSPMANEYGYNDTISHATKIQTHSLGSNQCF